MSVRRLADDSFQPEKFAFNDANARWAEATIGKYPEGRQQSAVIPLLMRAQDQDGWVTKPAIEYVADRLSMPLIRVLEVATFYTQFQLKPVGTRAHVQVCGTTPCMLRGAEDLKSVCRKKINAEPFHRNAEGTMSWEEVECLGACVNAPMVMIFEDTYEDLTPERLAEMLDLFEAGRGGEVKPGPQNGRHESVPIGGLTSLTGDYDDQVSHAPRERSAAAGSGGPANGAAPQGEGAGKAISTPPSNAGYPNTASAKTDPSIGAAGKATNGNVEPTQEDRPNDELVAQGHRAGAGQSGGVREGRTDAAERDAAESGQVSGDTHEAGPGDKSRSGTVVASRGDARSDGNRREKEGAADDAILSDSQRVDDSKGPQERTSGGKVDLSGKDQVGVANLEGQRSTTSDTATGPVQDDVFAGAQDAAGTGSREIARPMPAGEKPAALLDAPKGDKDDLKLIKGIGPVIEGKLNELGIFHFWQIAGWREPELVWIDDFLNFRGRAVRERWIDQARALQDGASDGTTV